MKTKTVRIASISIFLLLKPAFGKAQTFSLGLTAGTPLNPVVTTADDYAAATGRFTFGPAMHIGLPRGFGVDAELLYKRLEFGLALNTARATAHRLELPLMLRYAIPSLPVRPFVHAGISFNRVVAIAGADACEQTPLGERIYCIGGTAMAVLRHRHTHGPLLGIGLDFRWKRLELSPELRFTRWVDRNFGTQDSPLRSNLTGLELLCGFSF